MKTPKTIHEAKQMIEERELALERIQEYAAKRDRIQAGIFCAILTILTPAPAIGFYFLWPQLDYPVDNVLFAVLAINATYVTAVAALDVFKQTRKP